MLTEILITVVAGLVLAILIADRDRRLVFDWLRDQLDSAPARLTQSLDRR